MKLLLIDDHALFRDGLSLLISSRLFPGGGTVDVLEASGIPEALALVQAHADLALVLLDLGLVEHQGLATLQHWRSVCPHVPVVVLSADDRVEMILDAIDAGASGFIPKTAQAKVMKEALDHVLAGGVLPARFAGIGGTCPVRPVWIFRSTRRRAALVD